MIENTAQTKKIGRSNLVFGLFSGLIAAFLASLCCIGPALLALVGLGSLGSSLALPKLHGLFTGLGVLLLLGAIVWRTQRRTPCSDGQCPPPQGTEKKSSPAALAILGITVFAASYFVLGNWIGPALLSVVSPASAAPVASTDTLRQVTYRVKGMTCAGCSLSIEGALNELPGVVRAKVLFQEKMLNVLYSPNQVTLDLLSQTVATHGYEITLVEDNLAEGESK